MFLLLTSVISFVRCRHFMTHFWLHTINIATHSAARSLRQLNALSEAHLLYCGPASSSKTFVLCFALV